MNLNGKNVVVTGKIEGESRRTAEAKLQDAGANVQSSVTSTTDLLVTGGNVGATKMNKARANGVTVVSWDELNGSGASAPDLTEQVRELQAPSTETYMDRLPVRHVAPMLSKASDVVPTGDGWLFEIKWDGWRGIATVKDGVVTLRSRGGKSDLNEKFPEIAAELAGLPDCILDGELVVLDGNGNSSFQAVGAGRPSYLVFDILEKEGQDVRSWPLEARRELLEETMCELLGRVAVSPAFDDGEALLAHASEEKIEGIVAKRKDSRYVEGSRSGAWLKIKLRNVQEFVVVGWTPGEGNRVGQIGAVVLAVNDDEGNLVYVGRAGSGITEAESTKLLDGFKPLSDETYCEGLGLIGPPPDRDVVWVEPTTVVQVAFQRWTLDGILWHPAYQGIRIDKEPADVRRES